MTPTLLGKSDTFMLYFYFHRDMKFGFVTDLGFFFLHQTPLPGFGQVKWLCGSVSTRKEEVCPKAFLELVPPGALGSKQCSLLPRTGVRGLALL